MKQVNTIQCFLRTDLNLIYLQNRKIGKVRFANQIKSKFASLQSGTPIMSSFCDLEKDKKCFSLTGKYFLRFCSNT